MERRTFLRVVGGIGITSTVPIEYVWSAEKPPLSTAGVLVEAAAFASQGGWKLDTQHYQQMGGGYLLAHGMGKPAVQSSLRVRMRSRCSCRT